MKTLFVGNSHTYFNHMPRIFAELCILKGVDMHCTMLAHPGWCLSQHVEDPEVYFNVMFGEYDNVVIQQGAHPFPGLETLIEDGGKICEWAKKASTRAFAYMTWPEKCYPENRTRMREAYIEFAKSFGIELCPVGDAWKKAEEAGIDLYWKDGEHANPIGSYLAACVFLKVIAKQDPRGLPGSISFRDETLCDIDPKIAYMLQKIAAEI